MTERNGGSLGLSSGSPVAPDGLTAISAARTKGWLAPCLTYIVVVGLVGVTSKVALEDMAWQELVLWAAVAYITLSLVLRIGFKARLKLVPAARLGAFSGVLVVATLVALSIALAEGDVSQVIPVAASYPVLAVALAALILHERITPRRLTGTALVIAGVIVISI